MILTNALMKLFPMWNIFSKITDHISDYLIYFDIDV